MKALTAHVTGSLLGGCGLMAFVKKQKPAAEFIAFEMTDAHKDRLYDRDVKETMEQLADDLAADWERKEKAAKERKPIE